MQEILESIKNQIKKLEKLQEEIPEGAEKISTFIEISQQINALIGTSVAAIRKLKEW